MSRIGKLPISVPASVEVTLAGNQVAVKGPRGKLGWEIPAPITVERVGDELVFKCPDNAGKIRALHGLSRALVNNMIVGVSDGFTKVLEIQGVGYRAAVEGKKLKLDLGYSHPIYYDIDPDIKMEVIKNTTIKLESFDKQKLGNVAATIRKFRKVEPYKGKGIRYQGEFVRRKVGKKNV